MPLLDHFRSPTFEAAPWTSVGAQWIAWTIRLWNRSLPESGFRAFSQIHLGNMAEADIGEYEREPGEEWAGFDPASDGALATAVAPPPTATGVPVFPDQFQIDIHSIREGMRLVAVLEFISPSNKDRPGSRRQFVDKCISYIGSGIGVVLIDTITSRRSNLSNELVVGMGMTAPLLNDCHTYVSSFRPSPRDRNIPRLDMWAYPAEVGQRIPSVPLPLASGPPLMVDLESTYVEACADHGL